MLKWDARLVKGEGGKSHTLVKFTLFYIILGYIPFGIGLLFSFTKFSKLDWSNDLFYLLFKNFTKVINNISNKSQNKLNEALNLSNELMIKNNNIPFVLNLNGLINLSLEK